MKNILIVVSFFFFSHTLVAQSFAKDTVHLNFGIGLGWPYKFEKEYQNIWSLPAVNVNIERGIYTFDSIGTIAIGLSTSYKYLENKRQNKVATWNNFLIGGLVKFNFHYLNTKRIIPYAGVFGGINAINFKDTFYNSSTNYPTNYNGVFPIVYVFAGAKYISKPGYGILGELSYGFTYFTLGMYKVL